jgi:hypothetical protein
VFVLGGNQTIAHNPFLTKYGPDPLTEPLWSFEFVGIFLGTLEPTSISVARDGSVYFGGRTKVAFPGETYVDMPEPGTPIDTTDGNAFVAKLTADGELEWAHQWGTRGRQSTLATVPTADGGVVAAGDYSYPATTVTATPFAARFDSDGKNVYLEQYGPYSVLGDALSGLFENESGDIVLVARGEFLVVDEADGSELSRATMPDCNPARGYVPIVQNPDKSTFYVWATLGGPSGCPYPYDAGAYPRNGFAPYGLVQLDANLTVEAWWSEEPPRTATIDASENITWTGEFTRNRTPAQSSFVIGSDAIYLTGPYSNSYTAGLQTLPMFVGRYDLSGARVWFRELSFEGDPSPGGSFFTRGVVLDAAGDLIVAASNGPSDFLFKMSADDGSIF